VQPNNSFTSGSEYLVPTRVHADRGASVLELEWPDGHITRYDFETLRWLCPCAYCRGEAGTSAWKPDGSWPWAASRRITKP
jgi:hypothetical protein